MIALHFAAVVETLDRLPCVGPECDEGHFCPRHARVYRVASRYVRLVDRARRGGPEAWEIAAERVASHPGETLTQALARHGYTTTPMRGRYERGYVRAGRIRGRGNYMRGWLWLDRLTRKLAALRGTP